MGDVKLALLLGAGSARTVPVALMVGILAALVPAAILLARHGQAARKMSDPVRRRSSPSAASSPCSRATRSSHGYLLALAEQSSVSCQEHRARRRRRSSATPRAVRPTTTSPSSTSDSSRELVPRTELCASSRSRTPRRGSLPTLIDEGLARELATPRSPGTGCRSSTSPSSASPEATKLIPLQVLERVGAIPFAVEDDSAPDRDHRPGERPRDRRAAARDAPAGRVRRRAATRTSCSRSGASSRANEAFERASLDDDLRPVDDDERDDLEADDGISDGPLVRLVNSIIFQAAEDGASDVHFEPQEDALRRALPRRRRAPRRAARPAAAPRRRDDPPQGAREARHRRAAQAAGRPHLARRRGRRPAARHPRRDAADRRGRVGAMRLLDKSRRPPTLAELGLSDEHASGVREIVEQADRRAARHRPDRIGQVDDALRRAHRDQPARDQHDHGRGSGRVPARAASTRCRSTRAPA